MTTPPDPEPVVLHGIHAADLADLLRALHALFETEPQLGPLLDQHGFDIAGLQNSLSHYASLLVPTPVPDNAF